MADDPSDAVGEAYDPAHVQVIPPPRTFYALLAMIRERPQLVPGQKSLRILDAWLLGRQYGKMEAGSPPSEEELEFKQFDAFVCERYRWRDVGGWAAKIAYYYCDEALAFDEFFKLLDEFRAAPGRSRPGEQANSG